MYGVYPHYIRVYLLQVHTALLQGFWGKLQIPVIYPPERAYPRVATGWNAGSEPNGGLLVFFGFGSISMDSLDESNG